jgi:phasin
MARKPRFAYVVGEIWASLIATQRARHHINEARAGDHQGDQTPMSESKSARQAERISELSGATREFVRKGADFAKDVSDKTKATAEETNKAAGEAYATFASGAVEFHRQWIEMIRANTNATLDFVHQVLGVKSPSAFVELSAEHARKQAEAFAEQARHLTGMAQKLTTDMAAPMQAGMKNVFNKAA